MTHFHYSAFAQEHPAFAETDLWTSYTPQKTTFKIWSPAAQQVELKLYRKGDGGEAYQKAIMKQQANGLWQITVDQNLAGVYYTYQVKTKEQWLDETPGIYAQAVGVNGKRAMVTDLATTNPAGWEYDKGPAVASPNAIVLYEAHVRDLTISPSAGSSAPGKFLGLAAQGTKNPGGLATGLDHIKELGITHIHLLPSFDYKSVDETATVPQYNWGYDPQNYNVPEGSYATDPYQAEVRIREFKQMVKALHDNGLGVVMDVVYNHTGETEKSNFNLEVPGYYYRQTPEGDWSDASACGNETASERPIMRHYIIESCKYWAKEYHIDGFRFDLMAIHDIETMNQLTAELKKINPNIVVYGEGWTAGKSPLPDNRKALKANTYQMHQVAAFSDDLRDGLKGSVFEDTSKGFVSGASHTEESVKFGIVGSTRHPQVNPQLVNYSKEFWASQPWQAVSYVSCHDNHTLYDKLKISCPEATAEELKQMNLLADAVVLTSQGIPFIHAGAEMLRTKKGEHNSYNLPDSINQIDWNWKTDHQDVFYYYKNLIALRKAHPAFRMPAATMLQQHLAFVATEPGLIGYQLKDHAHGDTWSTIMVYYNARKEAVHVPLQGEWRIAAQGKEIDLAGGKQVKGEVRIPAISTLILFQE
ncbi:type I pullulanase [Pontibacter sp. SGAir0037]|uniref:type I pullulanase n=1 Tax=Pontibacter sp. SGAir0037 TaxID=2571030 RepID=UPI00143DE759|nr:type I pullulanase [Pontibacter sp. SGAir0037]